MLEEFNCVIVHATALKENAENARILAKMLPYSPHKGVPTSQERPIFFFGLPPLMTSINSAYVGPYIDGPI